MLTATLKQTSAGNDALASVPFDVEAAISLERLLTVEEGQRTGSWVLWSEDRSQFVVRTRRGDLQRNVNIESLWIFDAADVVRYLDAAAAAKPKPRAVVRRAVSVDWGLLSAVQWINDSEIGFISADDAGRRQVFRADARTGFVSQLTHSATDVASFAVTADRLVYFANSPVPADLVVPVVDQSLLQLQRWDKDPRLAPLELRVLSLVSQATIGTDFPPARLLPVHRKIWPSPDGQRAIVLGPDVDASQRSTVQLNTASWNLLDRIRFYVVDLSTGAARPLLDASSGWLARGCTPLEASWRSEQSVIISNTLLPVEGGVVEESAPFPVATEVDVTTGAAMPIVELPPCLGEAPEPQAVSAAPVDRVVWDEAEHRVRVLRRGIASLTQAPQAESYQRLRTGWQSSPATEHPRHQPLIVRLSEGLNTRPRLLAIGARCDCTREFFDPAPEADDYAFGRAQVVEWSDAAGIRWRAGLIHPPRYDPTRRYPLVVQTHGFDEDEFLFDGPSGISTAMAARPLANAGFLVLQVQDNPLAEGKTAADHYAGAYRAGIRKLIDSGIVDAERVGAVAFSRTGLPVIKLLADEPELLSAAIVADAGWWGYLIELILFNYPQDMAAQAREMTGGLPDSVDLVQYFAQNPLYRLSQVTTAVRLEAHGDLLNHWEHYFVLKRSGRTVDFVYFPKASHVLRKPLERLESQGGAVDWFRFWLLGEIDSTRNRDRTLRWCAIPQATGGQSPRSSAGAQVLQEKRSAACLKLRESSPNPNS